MLNKIAQETLHMFQMVDKKQHLACMLLLKITINVCWDPLPRTDSSNRVDSDSRIAFLGLYILLCSSTDDGRMIIKDCI